jgi:hypothetical protein
MDIHYLVDILSSILFFVQNIPTLTHLSLLAQFIHVQLSLPRLTSGALKDILHCWVIL